RTVRWGLQPEPAPSLLPGPDEYLLEQGMYDAASSPCGFYPHPAEPSPTLLRPVTEAIGRAQHVVACTGQEHHVPSGFGHGTGQLLTVRGRPARNVCEGLAEGIGRLLQGSQAKRTVKAHLMWLQSSQVHEIAHRTAGIRNAQRWRTARTGSRSPAEAMQTRCKVQMHADRETDGRATRNVCRVR